MENRTGGISKVLSFDFMKIQSDFDSLFSFPRYSRLKSGPVGPETYPAQYLGPNSSRTRFFPDMRFSPQGRQGLDLSFQAKKSMHQRVRFSSKVQKPPFSPFFGTFFNIFGKPDFFLKIRFSRFTRNTKLQLHAKNQKKLMNGSPDMKTDGHTHTRTTNSGYNSTLWLRILLYSYARTAGQFFLIFGMKLGDNKCKKLTKPNF